MARVIWLNGSLVPAEVMHLSVTDRGFQLGDGIFETLRARRGVAIEFDEHIARLRANAEVLALPITLSDEGFLTAIRGVLHGEGLAGRGADNEAVGDAAIRITVSRGPVEQRGLLPPGFERLPATIAIQVWPFAPPAAEILERGVRAITSSVRRDASSPLAGVKSTSRAESIVARLEAARRGADDAVMLTIDGWLSEGTTANVFLIRGTDLLTPPLTAAILPGTTRTWLLAAAPSLGLRPSEGSLRPEDLATADEALLSSSVAGIVPLTAFDGAPIGSGRPGPVTLRLRSAREAWVDAVSLGQSIEAAG
jgi:branched-chain amino acid aminotransferase